MGSFSLCNLQKKGILGPFSGNRTATRSTSLGVTQHPKSGQDFLGHASLEMTHSYWVTLAQAGSLEIGSEVEFEE